MNRLQMLKRALMSAGVRLKNLLYEGYLDRLKTKNATYTVLANGFSTTPSNTSGYGCYTHTILMDNPRWGSTYVLKCHIDMSINNMKSLMRVGYFKSDSHSFQNFKEITCNSGNGVYSITFTLPNTQPDLYQDVDNKDGWNDAFVRLFFNIQMESLEEVGTLTVTDIVLNEVI